MLTPSWLGSNWLDVLPSAPGAATWMIMISTRPSGASLSSSRRRKYATVAITAIGASSALLRYVQNAAASTTHAARP